MSFTANSEGGEYNHKLSIDEMPKHKHKFILRLNAGIGGYWAIPPLTANTGSNLERDDPVMLSGGDKPHNNIQPYFVAYYWERIQ